MHVCVCVCVCECMCVSVCMYVCECVCECDVPLSFNFFKNLVTSDSSSEWLLLSVSHIKAPMVNAVSKPPTMMTTSCAEAFTVLRSGHNEITAVSRLFSCCLISSRFVYLEERPS